MNRKKNIIIDIISMILLFALFAINGCLGAMGFYKAAETHNTETAGILCIIMFYCITIVTGTCGLMQLGYLVEAMVLNTTPKTHMATAKSVIAAMNAMITTGYSFIYPKTAGYIGILVCILLLTLSVYQRIKKRRHEQKTDN